MNYPRPVITADIILWHQSADGTKYVALIQRGKEPFENHFAFPGGHFDVDKDPSIVFAAVRELGEELSVHLQETDLWFFDYFDQPDRDPRGRYVDFVFTHKAESLLPLTPGDDAKADGGGWFTEQAIKEMPLAFDHARILELFFQIAKDD